MRTIVAVVCLFSVSCTSPYPSAIPAPEIDDAIRVEYNKYTSNAANKYLLAANSVKIYELQLWQKEQKLATQKYVLSDVGAIGAVTSVIAAASGALTTALYAGGVSAVGGVAAQRYNYDIQILNYRTTRQKLNCIYRTMTDIGAQELILAMDDSKSPSVIQLLKPYLNSVTSDIFIELQTVQSAVNLVTPDIKSIAGILDEQNKALVIIKSIPPQDLVKSPKAVISLADVIRTNIKMCQISPSTPPVLTSLRSD